MKKTQNKISLLLSLVLMMNTCVFADSGIAPERTNRSGTDITVTPPAVTSDDISIDMATPTSKDIADMIIGTNYTLNKNTSVNNLTLNGGTLDLNGHTLEVYGSIQQNGGTLSVNGGRLIVYGDYKIGTETSAPAAILCMTDNDDYVCVEGDFFINSSNASQLTNGILELKGDFTQISSTALYTSKSAFSAGGNHTTVFSGTAEQVISFEYPANSGFSILKLENPLVSCADKMRAFYIDGTGMVFDNLHLCGTCTALSDLTVSSLELDGGSFDLNGYTVCADTVTTSSSNVLFIDGGKLLVSGDMKVSQSLLKMNNKDDYVCVDGTFTISPYHEEYDESSSLTNGLLELKGDFVLEDLSSFEAAENHKILFNGRSTQTIYGNYYYGPNFNRVEFRNPDIVCSNIDEPGDSAIGVNVMEKCNAYFDNLSIAGECKLMDDLCVGNLSVYGMDLNGYTVTINGDCYCSGMLNINKGKLLVDGDLNVSSNGYGCLKMENSEDYICVNGDFSIKSGDPIENNLTDGVLEVKGDFKQLSPTYYNKKSFVPTQNHKTILSGTGVQNVTFEGYPDSKFNTLILTKDKDTGYSFTPSEVWTTLINAAGNETPSVPTNLNLVKKTSKTVKLSWTAPAVGPVLGYNIYRDNTLIGTSYTNSYADKKIPGAGDYTYQVQAFNAAKIGSELSEGLDVSVDNTDISPVIENISPSPLAPVLEECTFTVELKDDDEIAFAEAYVKPAEKEEWSYLTTKGFSEDSVSFEFKPDYKWDEWDDTLWHHNGSYDIKIVAYDSSGNETSKTYRYNIQAEPPYGAYLQVEPGDLAAKLNWIYEIDRSSDQTPIDYYKIYRKANTEDSYRYIGKVYADDYTEMNDSESDWISKIYTYTDDDLPIGRTYSYYIKTVTIYGKSADSTAVSVTPNLVDVQDPVANAGFDTTCILGDEVSFTGSNSTDNVGIVSYFWDFGDGITSTEADPVHTYAALKDPSHNNFDYIASLTVSDASGNSATSKIKVTVYPTEQTGTLNLTVRNSDNAVVKNAYVYIDLPGEGQKMYTTDNNGRVKISVTAGDYTISAYYPGYLPAEKDYTIEQYMTQSDTLILENGELVTQEVIVTPMSKEEIIEAGIDVSAPENQYVYTITTTLVFEEREITLPPVITSGTGTVYSGGNTYYYNSSSSSGGESSGGESAGTGEYTSVIVPQVIADTSHPEVPPTIAYLVIPTTVSWMKEFFNVQMVLVNQAPEAFMIQDSVVTLSLPDGLSLADTAKPQKLTIDLGDIAGQSTATAEWIIRGDEAGIYDLNADFKGVLMPFESDVNAIFKTEEAIKVYGENALKMYIYPEDTAYIGKKYYAVFEMVNQSDKPLYNFEWKFGTEAGTKYVLENASDRSMLPFMHDGDSIFIEELAPYEAIRGIYETTFDAEGDPDKNYYSLLDTLVSNGENSLYMIETEVIPLKNGSGYSLHNGAFVDQADIGRIMGQRELALKLYYISMLEDYLTAWGRNVSFTYGYTLTVDAYGRYVLNQPDGKQYYFMPDYTPITSGELTPNEVTVNINTMMLNGFTPISRGSKNYSLMRNGTGYIVETKTHTKLFFDNSGIMTRMEDKTGYAVDITSTESSITVKEEATGKTMTASIGADGFVDVVSDSTGSYTLEHDENGNVTKITDPLSQKTDYEYMEDKLTKKSTENAQNVKTTVFENEYDSEGRLASRTDGKGNTITYSYDTTSEYWRNIVAIRDRMGYNKTMVFNRFGELVKNVDALGNTTLYTYDGNGNRTSITDPNNNTVIYRYDDYDNLIKYIDAEGTETEYSYTGKSNLSQIKKADNSTITNTYDTKNQLTSSTDERGNVTSYSYDEKGNVTGMTVKSGNTSVSASYAYTKDKLTSFTDFRGNTTLYAYDPDYKHLTSVTDALNNVTSYQYDSKDRLTKITYPDKSAELYTYDERDNVTSYTDKNGNRTENTYDANNNLATVKDAGNFTTTYSYDKNDRLTEIKDCEGNRSICTYDEADNLISESDFNGNVTTYAYDPAARLLSETTAGSTTSYDYFKTGELKSVTDAEKNVTKYFYDKVGNVSKVTDAKGNDTVYTYDLSGNLASVATPEGRTSSFTYDFRNNVLTSTDAKHNTTAYVYDENGNLTSVTNALGKTTSYAYDELDRCISETDANGGKTVYTFDGMGNNTAIAKPLDVIQRFTYDHNGNILETADSNNVTTSTTTYNYNNAPLTVTDALNNTVTYEYDGLGNKTSYTTARGYTYLYEYDKNGNLTKETDPMDAVVEYTYNAFDKVTSFKDANSNTTSYSLDKLNRLTAENDAAGESDSSVYDAIGLLTQYTNKRGQVISYSYDKDSIMTGRTTVEGKTAYVYDANGNLTEVTDSNGTIYRTYDRLNRITSYTDANGSTIIYDYDDVGNLTQLTYPDNKIVRYSYNANNQLERVQDWANRVTIYTYDNNGRLSTTTRPDGSREVYNYDENGRLLTASDFYANGNVINQYNYTYDADGNITDEYSLHEPDVNEIGINSAEMSYGAANRLTDFNGTAIAYDADGNMLSTPLGDTFGTLAYDSLNQLNTVTAGDKTYSYTYDAEGYRTSKTENGITTNFVVDPNAELSRVLMSTTGNETTYYVYGLGLISQEKGADYRLYHYDYRGSTTAMTTLGGAVVDTMFYDAYGNIVKRTGADETPFLYVGKYGVETDNNGLYYMRARYYNPQIQRFINVDPIRDGYNWYGYADGNPIRYLDYSGNSVSEMWQTIKNYYKKRINSNPIIQTEILLLNDEEGLRHLGKYALKTIAANSVANVTAVTPYTVKNDIDGFISEFNYQTKRGNADSILHYFLSTEKHDNIYHIKQECKQLPFGYNDFYDFVFEGFVGYTGNASKDYKFTFNYDNNEVILWGWKGDYVNLGTGAELGIYTKTEYNIGNRYQYMSAPQYSVPMTITISDHTTGDCLAHWDPSMSNQASEKYLWWVTAFNPQHQNVKYNDLDVQITMDCSNNIKMFNAIKNTYDYNKNNGIKNQYNLYFENDCITISY